MKITSNKGFTLVELSIVLLIIGLITSGVLVGRDLFEAAGIRNVIAQLKKLDTSVGAFQTKYNWIPGDIGRAQQYGLTAPGSDCTDNDGDGVPESANPNVSNPPNDLGCGGNNNGLLEPHNIIGRQNFTFEYRNFWHHLFAADMYLLPGNGTNAVGGGFPASAIGSGINVISRTIGGTSLGNNFFVIGAIDATQASPWVISFEELLTPFQAYSIDLKLDNAIPDTGIATTREGLNAQWVGTFSNVPGAAFCGETSTGIQLYNTTHDGFECQLRIRFGA